jgi:hypothetical protein
MEIKVFQVLLARGEDYCQLFEIKRVSDEVDVMGAVEITV